MKLISAFIDGLRYKLTKTEKNLWVFTSFGGHYSDSPKRLSDKLHEIAPHIHIVWLVDEKYLSLLPEHVVGVVYNSKEAKAFFAKAEIVIDNVYGQRAYTLFGSAVVARLRMAIWRFFYSKKTQHIYTTWHGTPLKRMGVDQVGNNVTGFCCPYTTMLLGNSFTAEIMQRLTFRQIPIRVLGTPRNDLLFSADNLQKEAKLKLGILPDKKVILYAPTFRNDGKDTQDKNVNRSGLNQLKELDLHDLFNTLSLKFGDDWVFVGRFHYHVEKLVDWTGLNREYAGKIINGNLHDDMVDYLICADVLLTDASSCMFDFALTKRPCFLYFPDLENYRDRERGFYIDVDDLPFPMATDYIGLKNNIEGFDSNSYKTAVQAMFKRFGYVDHCNSSEDIIRYILSEEYASDKNAQ